MTTYLLGLATVPVLAGLVWLARLVGPEASSWISRRMRPLIRQQTDPHRRNQIGALVTCVRRAWFIGAFDVGLLVMFGMGERKDEAQARDALGQHGPFPTVVHIDPTVNSKYADRARRMSPHGPRLRRPDEREEKP